jgi:superfamily I DNA and/or RNA helicase
MPLGGGFEGMSNSSASQASYFNEMEAEVLVQVVKELVGHGLEGAQAETSAKTNSRAGGKLISLGDVGVITPYNAQVSNSYVIN